MCTMLDMAVKHDDGKPIGLRVRPDIMERLRTAQGDFRPRITMTAILEDALLLWLEKHERAPAKPSKPPAKK